MAGLKRHWLVFGTAAVVALTIILAFSSLRKEPIQKRFDFLLSSEVVEDSEYLQPGGVVLVGASRTQMPARSMKMDGLYLVSRPSAEVLGAAAEELGRLGWQRKEDTFSKGRMTVTIKPTKDQRSKVYVQGSRDIQITDRAQMWLRSLTRP